MADEKGQLDAAMKMLLEGIDLHVSSTLSQDIAGKPQLVQQLLVDASISALLETLELNRTLKVARAVGRFR